MSDSMDRMQDEIDRQREEIRALQVQVQQWESADSRACQNLLHALDALTAERDTLRAKLDKAKAALKEAHKIYDAEQERGAVPTRDYRPDAPDLDGGE